MRFERVFELAKSLGLSDFEVKFAQTENPSDEAYQWKAVLHHHFGTVVDYGPTPVSAIEAVEVALYRKVEDKMKHHEEEAAKFRAVLLPSKEGE